jgi:hypothetical protein
MVDWIYPPLGLHYFNRLLVSSCPFIMVDWIYPPLGLPYFNRMMVPNLFTSTYSVFPLEGLPPRRGERA